MAAWTRSRSVSKEDCRNVTWEGNKSAFHRKNFWKQNESFHPSEHSWGVTQAHKHIQCNGNMINNVQDTGIRLRKKSIQSMKGRDSGVTRIVDTVHYSGDGRLFALGVGTGQRNPHRIYVWTECCQMSRSSQANCFGDEQTHPQRAMFVQVNKWFSILKG